MTEQTHDSRPAGLERALRALADDERHARVPPQVHVAVMRVWDATATSIRPRPAAQPSWWPVILAGAVAAAALVATLSVTRSRPDPGSHEAAPVVITERTLSPAEAPRDAGNRIAKRPVRARRDSRLAARARTARVESGIVLVADPVLDASALSVVRVRMPRSALALFGIPIADPDATGSVDLEVLVGEDGIARTIRRALPVIASDPEE